jgi:large subunit ribosomal protein L1
VVGRDQVLNAVREARQSEKRRFIQTLDLEIRLRGVDTSKPENTFVDVYALPKGLGSKKKKVCIIADTATLPKARESGAERVLSKEDLVALAGDKKAIRKLARQFDFFVADASLMATVGRTMGQILGPRNKVPTPLPPGADPKVLVQSLKNSVRVRLKGQPVVRTTVGSEDMSESDLTENALSLIDRVTQKLKGGQSAFDTAVLKLTMGKPVKIVLKGEK